jgi:hypothetical protein
MPQETFNPISDPFDKKPPQHPGTVLVAFRDGAAIRIGAEPNVGIRSRVDWSEYLTPKNLASRLVAPIVVAIFVLWLLGGLGTFIVMFLAGAVAFWVILNRREPVVVQLLGALPEYYRVDVSRHTVRDERRTQLADAGVYVVVNFEYRAKVTNPEQVVERGVRDVREYLSDRFYVEIDARARKGTLRDELAKLRDTLEDFFKKPPTDELISVNSITFDLSVEGAPGRALAKLSEESIRKKEIEAQGRLDTAERDNLVTVISNDELLLAEVMRSDDKRVQELIKLRMEQQNIGFQRNLSLFKVALEEGILEAHQIRRDYPDFFKALTTTMPGLVVETKRIASNPAPASEDKEKQ